MVTVFSNSAWALTAQQLQTLQSAARQAQQVCLKEMHHDTDEFVACVDEMRISQKIPPEKHLGFAYLGLVGCLSAARISTLHSNVCSHDYLLITDRLIKQLHAKDIELCSAVPGDCTMRVAQIKAMRVATKAIKTDSAK